MPSIAGTPGSHSTERPFMLIRNLPSPFMAPDGGAPAGGGAPTGGTGGSPSFSPSSAGGGTPQPITLSEDALIQPPGYKEPVKYSDFMRGYIPQSEFTKKAQALAKERQEFERRKEEATKRLLAEAQRIAALQSQGNAQRPNLLDQIRDAKYVDGQTVAGLVEALQTQGIAPIVEAIQKRDVALTLMYRRMQEMDKALRAMQSRSTDQAFIDRVQKVREQLGLPDHPEAKEFLMDIYASHEGDDLDQAFPELARKRLEGLRNVIREMDRKQAEDARRRLIPGRGGNAAPSNPLRKGYRTPQQIAEELGTALGLE